LIELIFTEIEVGFMTTISLKSKLV